MQREELGIGYLFDHVRDAIIVADAAAGRIVLWNAEAESIFGYSASEAVGLPIEKLVPDRLKAQHARGISQFVETGRGVYMDTPQAIELPALRKDGTEFSSELTLGSLRSRSEGRLFVVATVRDVTHRKQLEERLAQSERLEAIGLLAGGVAHDFNNVLQAVLGFSELVLARLDPEDALRPLVTEISAAGDRGAALTRQLLAFGMRQQLMPQPLDLSLLVAGMEETLRTLIGEKIHLVLLLGPDLSAVEADSGQLAQVVLNLCDNARAAMPDGGELTIEAKDVELDKDDVVGREPMVAGSYVSLIVRDTGKGMDREILSHIFEPFFTTKPRGQGPGLGLASVYGIVKQSRGYIWADSTPGRGSTFSVYFPRTDDEPSIEIPDTQVATQVAAKTVLVVDDDSSVLRLASTVLADRGYGVLEAGRGDRALRIAERHRGPIDLLVTDVRMPGMSGVELADRVRSQRAEIKVLYMSGYSERMLEPQGGVTNAEFLQKPFTPDQLADRVAQLLGSQSSSAH